VYWVEIRGNPALSPLPALFMVDEGKGKTSGEKVREMRQGRGGEKRISPFRSPQAWHKGDLSAGAEIPCVHHMIGPIR
jgi:hypothetical protein